MPILAKRVFSDGEVDPALRARLDAQPYQTGLRTLRNAVVKKTGGIRNRPGTKFVARTASMAPSRLLEMDLADGLGDSFAIEMGNGTARFHKNQIPVREVAQAITGITQANPGVFTIDGYNWNPGDTIFVDGEEGMIQVNNREFLVVPLNANTFSVTDPDGNAIDTTNYSAFAGGGTAARSYTIPSPFQTVDLPYLNYDQAFQQIKIASGGSPSGGKSLQDLDFISDTNWTLANSLFEPSISAPVGVAVSVPGTDSSYAVTAIKQGTGEESLASIQAGATGSSGTPNTITWTNQNDAFFYQIYRADASGAYGLIGVAAAQASPTFIDDNSRPPDLTKTPPGVAGTLFNFGFTLDKVDPAIFPDAPLPGPGKAIAWSPDGTLLAVGCNTTPFILIYLYQNGVFTLLPTSNIMGALPLGVVNGLAWSPDGSYLAVALSPASGSVRAILYKRTGQSFAANTSGFTQPTGNAFGISWSSDSLWVCFAHATTPFMTVLSRSADIFTKSNDSNSLPTAQANCCVFLGPMTIGIVFNPGGFHQTATGHVLMVGQNLSGGVSLKIFFVAEFPPYMLAIDGLMPATVPGGEMVSFSSSFTDPGESVLSLSFSSQSVPAVLTAGLGGGNFIQSQLTADGLTYTAIANPTVLPDGAVNGISETEDGSHVALATSGTRKLLIYDRIANVLVQETTQPTPDLTGNGSAIDFSPDASLLAVTQSATSPYAAMYEISVIHPACVGFCNQQRLRIGNTDTNPSTEYDSAVDAFTNFAIRTLPTPSDPIQFKIGSRKYNALKHLLELKKLIQLTSTGAIVLEGDQNGTITPDLQAPRMTGFNGANHVRPAMVGESAIYVGAVGNTVFDLKKEVTASSYFSSDNFFVTDLTSPSAHMFRGKKITWCCYQEKPDSIVWFGMDDGSVNSMTYVREQEIVGWGRHDMGGLGTFEDGCCIREADGTDRVYLQVNIGTALVPRRCLVAMQDRDVTALEDQFFVDCGVTYDGRQATPTTLSFNAGTLTASTGLFAAANVGQVLRLHNSAGGTTDFAITAFTSSTVVSAAPRNAQDPTQTGFSTLTAEWSWLTQTVDGLWHLEGHAVSILADGCVISSPNNPFLKKVNGDVVPPTVVTNGIANFSGLGFWAEVAHVGLPFTCDIETLEMDEQQGPSLVETEKNVPRVTVKVNNTKGLFFSRGGKNPGTDSAQGFQRGFHKNNVSTQDLVGAPAVPLLTTQIKAPLDGNWNSYGRVLIRQVDPAPVEIVGIFPATAV